MSKSMEESRQETYLERQIDWQESSVRRHEKLSEKCPRYIKDLRESREQLDFLKKLNK